MFSERGDLSSIANEPEAQKIMFTVWFEANKDYPEAPRTT